MGIKKSAGILLLACAFFAASCTKEDKAESHSEITGDELEIKPSEIIIERSIAPKWSGDEGNVLVVFGYGFNEDEIYNETRNLLAEEFGLMENGGLVGCLRFPEDFHNRISNLRSIVDEHNVIGLVVLGAPEGTHEAFAKIREDRNHNIKFSIISFFPQDDILGQEGTCTIVLDHQGSGMMHLEEEKLEVNSSDLKVIASAVKYAALMPSELSVDNELHAHVQAIAGKRKVHRYVDGETGIQSRNHFVIEGGE